MFVRSDGPSLCYRMAILTRVFRTNSRLIYSGLGPLPRPNLRHLHPRLDLSTCTLSRSASWRSGTLSCRHLSTHAPPPQRPSHHRLVSARELYAQRNRSLFMYTSAVVRPHIPPFTLRESEPATHRSSLLLAHLTPPCRSIACSARQLGSRVRPSSAPGDLGRSDLCPSRTRGVSRCTSMRTGASNFPGRS